MSVVDAAVLVVGLALTAAFWVFIGVYALTARWEASPVGRNLFTFALSCALILTLSNADDFIGDHLALDVARLVLFTAVLVVVVRLTVFLIRTQMAARRARKAPPDPEEEQPDGT